MDSMNTIIIPIYLLDEAVITDLITTAQDVMVELAGESPTPELPPLIAQLRNILSERTTKLIVVK
jgi:hypothetical protein